VAFIGGLIWALCAQTGDDPARVVNAGCEKDRVGTILERITVERLLDPMFAVALTCTVNVVPPQIPLDRRLREYDGAFALRIPTAGSPLQADKVAARGLSLENGHSCPFLGQPANNCVGWLSEFSISPPVTRIPASNSIFSCKALARGEIRAADQTAHGFVAIACQRIVTGDHPFVCSSAKFDSQRPEMHLRQRQDFRNPFAVGRMSQRKCEQPLPAQYVQIL
jgi:hypothetical protein